MKTSTRRFFSLGRRVNLVLLGYGRSSAAQKFFFKIFGFNKFVYLCLPKKSGSKICFEGKVL